MSQLTLIRTGESLPPPATLDGYHWRPCRPADVDQLGALYFHSYDPGQASATLAEARADIQAVFDGAYGRLWPEASLVAVTGADEQIVGAIQVVQRAPWPDTPDCPFAIEVFTDRAHRRRGIARALLVTSLRVLAHAGQPRLALRVLADNHPARSLYRSLGFHDWVG